jgi:hypothetical protein
MIKRGSVHIFNVVGIALVIVALVCAGGIYYTASSYANITETLVNFNGELESISITSSLATGSYTFVTTFLFDNTVSSLDVDIYMIEYNLYAYNTPTSRMEFNNYIGAGRGIEGGNGTIEAGTTKEVRVIYDLKPDSPYFWNQFNSMIVDNSVFIVISGTAWFKIVDYPDVPKSIDFYYPGQVIINEI